jgi:hypothetical protein
MALALAVEDDRARGSRHAGDRPQSSLDPAGQGLVPRAGSSAAEKGPPVEEG